MMLLSQAATDTGVDLAKILGIGGPSSIATLIIVWVAKIYFDNRKSRREDSKSERESESGIVETTSALTKLVREQMVDLNAQIKALRLENERMQTTHREELERLRSDHQAEIDKLSERVRGLEAENDQLRRERYGRG